MNAPLLDTALADQFFSATGAEEMADLKAMLREFEADVSPRFAALYPMCPGAEAGAPAARRSLHGLRGVVANFALARAAERLRTLETGWLTLSSDVRFTLLRESEADVRTGVDALRQRYPYLG